LENEEKGDRRPNEARFWELRWKRRNEEEENKTRIEWNGNEMK
jgi:hypothetical protein